MTSRCHHCGDPAPRGWAHCLHCLAWDDLAQSLGFSSIGLDEYRLRRSLAYLRGRRHVESVESLLRKLTRRVAELEQAAMPALNDRLHCIEYAEEEQRNQRSQHAQAEERKKQELRDELCEEMDLQ